MKTNQNQTIENETKMQVHRWMQKFTIYEYVRQFNDNNPSATINDLISQLNKELN